MDNYRSKHLLLESIFAEDENILLEGKNINTWKWATPITKNNINKVEKYFKIKFPTDYSDFILKNNGGKPLKKYFKTKDKKEHILESLISLISTKDSQSLIKTYLNVSDRLPKKIIPIGLDPFGNFICFDFNQSSPSICFWDHEIAFKNPSKSIIKIASSFTEFLNSLY